MAVRLLCVCNYMFFIYTYISYICIYIYIYIICFYTWFNKASNAHEFVPLQRHEFVMRPTW